MLTQLELRRKLIEFDTAVRELDEARTEVVAEKRRTDELLANILPAAIADELKRSGKVQPKYASSATILFADFKNFSLLAERVEPAALVGTLDQYFTAFDEIIARHGLEKIKTIGDAYMAVAGVPATSRHHPFDACLAALDIEATMARIGAQRQKLHLPSLELRIGLHTGPVISGVVGRRRFTFDIWGDAVNTAALMEENGAPGRINASETVASYVRTLFELEPRDAIRTKHGRQLEMFFLNRIRPELSRDAEGRLPNEKKFATECARLLTGFSAA
ncbi:adenylate/guanylate cyclase domain-containing protein [Roseibium salinum]|nr:adenylate/guanylate cyclase domain-containing protein [Roseibium salinum]